MRSKGLLPVQEAALRLGMSRERVIRRVTTGALRGELQFGRWFVEVPESAKAASRRATDA